MWDIPPHMWYHYSNAEAMACRPYNTGIERMYREITIAANDQAQSECNGALRGSHGLAKALRGARLTPACMPTAHQAINSSPCSVPTGPLMRPLGIAGMASALSEVGNRCAKRE